MRKTLKLPLEMLGQALTLFLGIYLLWLNFYADFSFGSGDLAIWNKRLFFFLAILSIAASTWFIQNELKKKIISVAFTAFILTMITFIASSGFGMFDALTEDGTYALGDMWAGFDANTGNSEWVEVGIFLDLLAGTIDTLFPITMIGIGLIQAIYSGESDEFTKALFELGIAVGAMVVYSFLISPNFSVV